MMKHLLLTLFLLVAPVSGWTNLDETNDSWSCGSDTDIDDLSALTVSFHLQKDAESAFGIYVCKGGGSVGWCLNSDTSNNIRFRAYYDTTDLLRYGSTALSTALTDVYVVVVTWDGSTTATNAHIYLNGTEDSYGTTQNGVGSLLSDAASDLMVGDNSASVLNPLDGKMEYIAIWNSVLSASDIATISKGGGRAALRVSQKPLRYYEFNTATNDTNALPTTYDLINGIACTPNGAPIMSQRVGSGLK